MCRPPAAVPGVIWACRRPRRAGARRRAAVPAAAVLPARPGAGAAAARLAPRAAAAGPVAAARLPGQLGRTGRQAFHLQVGDPAAVDVGRLPHLQAAHDVRVDHPRVVGPRVAAAGPQRRAEQPPGGPWTRSWSPDNYIMQTPPCPLCSRCEPDSCVRAAPVAGASAGEMFEPQGPGSPAPSAGIYRCSPNRPPGPRTPSPSHTGSRDSTGPLSVPARTAQFLLHRTDLTLDPPRGEDLHRPRRCCDRAGDRRHTLMPFAEQGLHTIAGQQDRCGYPGRARAHDQDVRLRSHPAAPVPGLPVHWPDLTVGWVAERVPVAERLRAGGGVTG